MARTFRNKSTLPVGWTVRDDGMPYRNGNDLFGNSLYDEVSRNRTSPKYRRPRYRCERTGARRQYNWTYRAKTNHLTRVGRWEDILPPTRTSGWLTW